MIKVILCTSFLLFLHAGYSQTEIIAKYDKAKKTIKKLDKSSSTLNDGFKIKVTGVHSVLHKVSFEFEDFSWHSEPPEGLKTILPEIYGTAGSSAVPPSGPDRYKRVLKIQAFLNSAKKELETSFDGANWSADSDKTICDKYVNKIATLYTDDKEVLSAVAEDIQYFIGEYESILKIGEADYIGYLAENKLGYENIKKIQGKILSGLKAIIGGKSQVKGNSSSKVHLPKKEATTVKIYVIDRFNPSDTITSFKQDVYRMGKFKIDFSAGLGVNSLLNPSYYIGKNDTIPFIGEEEKRDIDLTLISLAHFNWRLLPWFSAGPTIGASVSIFDAKPTFLLGGGLSFGKQRSVSLSGGMSFGKVNVLSKKVSTDGITADLTLDSDISEVPTYGKIKFGYFISLTYNLKRTKKK